MPVITGTRILFLALAIFLKDDGGFPPLPQDPRGNGVKYGNCTAEYLYKHYTIVLTPPADQAAKAVKMSQAIASGHQSEYVLNLDGTSTPHVTLVQFDCPSYFTLSRIWRDVQHALREERYFTCDHVLGRLREISTDLLFTEVAFIEGTGQYKNLSH